MAAPKKPNSKSTKQTTRRQSTSRTKVMMSLLGAGGLTTIAVAIINRTTGDASKPATQSNHVTASSGGTAFVASNSNINIGTNNREEINLLEQIRDLLTATGRRELPLVEAQAQREALEVLASDQNASAYRLSSDAPKWLRIAFAEIGESEIEGDKNNPRILQYLAGADLDPTSLSTESTPWSGAFISWVLQEAGCLDVPRSAAISAFANWGTEVLDPTPGTLVLIDWGRLRSGETHRRHGGFFLKDIGNKVVIIGGNVQNGVRIQAVPKQAVYAYRNPPKA